MSETLRMLWLAPARTRILFYGAAVLFGAAAASLVMFIPPEYLIFVLGGLIFVYLLLVRIEAAIIIALLLQTFLGQYNYLGQGTPFHPNGFIGFAIIGGTAFYFAFNKVEIPGFRKIGWFLAFVALCVISTLTAPREYLMTSMTVTLRLVTSLCIFAVLLVRLDSIQSTKWVLAAVIASQLPSTISRLTMRAGSTGISFTSDTLRLGNSGLGIAMGIILTLCLSFFLDAKATRARLLWGILTALFAAALFFSFGRSAWLSFLVALAVIAVARHKWIFIIIPVAVVLFVMLIPGITERFADISLTSLSSGRSTMAGRIEIWRGALEVFPQHPLFGVGLGTGAAVVGQYLNQPAGMIHNDYLSLLLEVGLIGLALFLAWHIEWLLSLLRVHRQATDPYDKTLALAVVALFSLSLVARSTDNMILDAYDMYPLSALVAAALALPRLRAKMEQRSA